MAKLSDLFGRKIGEHEPDRRYGNALPGEPVTAPSAQPVARQIAPESYSDIGSRIGEENGALRHLLNDAGRKIGELDELKSAFEKIVIPFNAPLGEQTAITIGSGLQRDLYRREIIPAVDQYTAQAEAFALAVLGKEKLPYGIEDAITQMKVLDAIFRSEKSGTWDTVR